jgi:hypothetical protein
MKNWLMMFRPETYEVVKEAGVIGVLDMHRRRFAELADGDRFLAYISRRQVLDGYGTIVGSPYVDLEPLWPGKRLYPQRCRVAVERTGAAMPAKELLWELDVWAERVEPLKTQPWNMLLCYGGFMAVPDSDWVRLRGMVDGHVGNSG